MKIRDYQIEIYNKAKNANVIVKLNTGSGKTFIASMLIKDYLNLNTNKKIFFLVKNSSLVYQHTNSLKEYLFLKDEIGYFYGQMENSWVDNWTKDKWSEKLSKYKIIVMTAKVFLDILNHNKYNLNQVCYLIFDEVHHLTKSDDYSQISEHVIRTTSDIKVLGLTACLIKGVKQVKDIEFAIKELEYKLNCTVVTSTNDIACDFCGNVKETIIDYQTEQFPELVALFKSALEKLENIIPADKHHSKSNFGPLNEEQNILKTLKKYLNDCFSVLYTLGVVPCKLITDMFIEEIHETVKNDNIFDDETKMYFDEFLSCLKVINSNIESSISKSDILMCSEKCKKLINLIFDLKSKNLDFQNTVSILIFVHERIHALALNELLGILPKVNKDFDFINSKFIIGHSANQYPKKLQISIANQFAILKLFKEKKINILISTNVVEEGLDISHCNIVVKFDPPQDFRSYLQSKGRARAQNSQYIVFTHETDKTEMQIKRFNLINQELNKILKSKVIEDELTNDDSDINVATSEDNKFDYIPYGEAGPRITLNSASGVLNRYIGKLRCNSISEPKIIYTFRQNQLNFYQAFLLLPMPAPYLQEIEGTPCSNKRRAKQFVNLEACKILHRYDELDSSLLPFNRYDIDTNLSSHENNQLINQYEKYTASKLNTNFQSLSIPPNELYLYSIKYSPCVFLKLGINDISMFDMSTSLGILLPKPIHKSESFMKFPIYLVGGVTSVEIKFEYTLPINTIIYSLLLKCHKTLFSIYSERIRKFDNNIFFDPSGAKSYIIVSILKDNKIYFDKINEIINNPSCVNLIKNDQSSWVGSVIRPTYITSEFGAFVISKVCYNMNAGSILKNKTTYEEYVNKKYNINLSPSEKSLPLIKVIRLTTIQSCVNKEKRFLRNNRKLQRINESECYFVPCLTECISLSSSLWTQLCIFPTIHHRMNQILSVDDFAHDLPFMNLIENSDCIEIDFDDCYNIEDIESPTYSPSYVKFINNIFPCFIAKTCNDRTNLEQFEILGDSFLKFITSKYLFHFSAPTDNEGKLTQKRSQLISNKNLFDLATQKGLDKYFCYTNFNPKCNYLPPNFIVKNSDESSKARNSREFVLIKNKNLADCCEAIIGSLLINYGIDYSIKYLLWLNLPILPDNQSNFDIDISTNCAAENVFMDSEIPQSINDLENILNYKFKNKGYIVQAITHPSSITNRRFSCYQRLEFLGDSVIDFLVTIYIMLDNKKLNPGKITNLRSALVNNNTFAYLSVKFGFHKYLNYFDSKMFHILPKVVEELLNNQLQSSHSYLRKSEQFKVVVKVLGDIFESIAGAIFVDSNYDLKSVWTVYKVFMEEPLNKFCNNIPRNKISMLHEKYPQMKCTYQIQEFNSLIKLTAVLPDGSVKEKYERNKVLCKLALAEELDI